MPSVVRIGKNPYRAFDWITLGCVILVVILLATLSILRYTGYTAAMFDLGHMAQAIWSSTQGKPLEFSYHGDSVSRLGLHVELIYFLITPLYALFPSPVTLLLIQATLFGTGALPVYRLAKRQIGSITAARMVTLVYLLFPMAQTAVLYDFHGETLAMPLLLFALEALDREAWRAYGLWLVLALSCKINVAASVCILGASLWFNGKRRVGGLTLLVGLVWGIGVFVGLRPLFAVPGGTAQQWTALGYLEFYFGKLFVDLAGTWLLRLATAVAVFAPVVPLAIYAPRYTVLALGVALPILLSSGPGPSFYYGNHRYAMVVPFLLLIVVWGAARLRVLSNQSTLFAPGKRSVTWPVALGATLFLTLLVNSGLVNTPLSPRFYSQSPDQAILPWVYSRTARDMLKDRWLAQNVPEVVPLLASQMLAPHLTQRQALHVMVPLDDTEPLPLSELLDKVAYVVLDGLLDYVEPKGKDLLTGNVAYDWAALSALNRPDFGLVIAQDGLLLLQKRVEGITDTAWAEMTLEQSVTAELAGGSVVVRKEFGNAVGLVDISIIQLRDRLYRLEFVWLALEGIHDVPQLFAVTQPSGMAHARILHVPTIALYPTTAWTPGELITETFEVQFPADIRPGQYTLSVSWYNSADAFAFLTGEQSRVGVEAPVGQIVIPQ